MGKHTDKKTIKHVSIGTGIATAIALSIAAVGGFGVDGGTAPVVRPTATATATQNGPVSDADVLADAPMGSYLTPYSGDLGEAMENLYDQAPRIASIAADEETERPRINFGARDPYITYPGQVIASPYAVIDTASDVTEETPKETTDVEDATNTEENMEVEAPAEPEAPTVSDFHLPANTGTLAVNDGTVDINTFNGFIVENQGHVGSNYGAIGYNNEAGTVSNNNGVVFENHGTVENDKYGYVDNNYGTVHGGRVQNNYGTVVGGYVVNDYTDATDSE